MSRTLSLNFREALFDQQSGEVGIFLLTIEHDDLDEPIRLSSDATERLSTTPLYYGTQSRGETYTFVGMQVTLPDEEDRNPPAAKMVISNVDRSIIPLARSIVSPARVRIEAVLASDPDTVEFEIPEMDITHLNYSASQLTFDLAIDPLALEPYPAWSFNPSWFPGLFS